LMVNVKLNMGIVEKMINVRVIKSVSEDIAWINALKFFALLELIA
jgi:hypothetical protein